MVTKVVVSRKTEESLIRVGLDVGPRDPRAKERIASPIPFFNHMLEHVAWRGEMNVDIIVEVDHFNLAHLVTEDVGIAFGKAVQEYVKRNANEGIVGYGFAYGTIDESLSRAVISFESRALFDFTVGDVQVPREMEGMNSEDLVAFFEGFVQGAQCTLHLDLIKGRPNHGHHIWESAFRGFGQALREALQVRPWRKDMTAGVAGQINYEIKAE